MKNFDPAKDYYGVLGVSPDASKDDIDRAYRSAARRRHPDGGGSEEEMKSLNEARDVLGNSELRKSYDAERASRRAPQPSEVYRSSVVFDPEAASRAGTLEISVSDGDPIGLIIGAAACFGVGIPFLLLVEMQWMFFLWPLRVLALGALAVGAIMAHSALKAKNRQLIEADSNYPHIRIALRVAAFWAAASVGLILLVLFYFVW